MFSQTHNTVNVDDIKTKSSHIILSPSVATGNEINVVLCG